MNESNVVELKAPAEDTLGELLKEGAMLAQSCNVPFVQF